MNTETKARVRKQGPARKLSPTTLHPPNTSPTGTKQQMRKKRTGTPGGPVPVHKQGLPPLREGTFLSGGPVPWTPCPRSHLQERMSLIQSYLLDRKERLDRPPLPHHQTPLLQLDPLQPPGKVHCLFFRQNSTELERSEIWRRGGSNTWTNLTPTMPMVDTTG